MTEATSLPDIPRRNGIFILVVGTTVSALLVTAVGSVIGMMAWPLLRLIHRRANSALDIMVFLVDGAALVIVLWLLMMAVARVERGTAKPGGVTVGSLSCLRMAKLATAIQIVELTFSFIRGRASMLLIVQIGNATNIDFLNAGWVLVFGVVLPILLLWLLLRWAANRTNAEATGA